MIRYIIHNYLAFCTVSTVSLKKNRGALGYTVYFYLPQATWGTDILRILDIGGVTPSHATILSGEYPLTANYFAVIRADTPADDPARQIAQWLLTPAGQEAVREAGLGTLEIP